MRFIHSFVRSFVPPFIHSSIHPFICLFVYLLHCTGAGFVFMAMLSLLAVTEGVISTTYGAASDESAVWVTTFPFQWASKDDSDGGAICAGGRVTMTSPQSHCGFSLCASLIVICLHIIIILCNVCLFYVLCRTRALVATVICWLYPMLVT